jgi:hypothetical protein
MNKVEYRPLSQSKHKCVWCVNSATQEAFKSQGNLTLPSAAAATIRSACGGLERCVRAQWEPHDVLVMTPSR